MINEFKRLNFEDIIALVFILIALFNIYGNNLDKKYILTNNSIFAHSANKIYLLALKILFFTYIYFFVRNYMSYKKASFNQKSIFQIKLLGSILFLVGSACLIYFQANIDNFIGSPAI